jgi:diaminopropionate ammonia-lyase
MTVVRHRQVRGELALLTAFTAAHVRHVQNPSRAEHPACPSQARTVLPSSEVERAQREIAGWRGYGSTPLHHLVGLAGVLGIDSLWLKDESSRFGLGSFKALGGAYAVRRLVAERLGAEPSDVSLSLAQSASRRAEALRSLTVTCATDGNHGRAVAWGARQIGCQCVIYIHAGVSEGREAALRRLGAEVVRVAANYDDSVRIAAERAHERDWILVADTAAHSQNSAPLYVMAGYAVLMREIREQLAHEAPPTHLFVQAGVGGLAAAVIAGACDAWGSRRPRVIVAEPGSADCVFRSIVNQRATPAPGPLDTVMAGLSCGEVSPGAWPLLHAAIDDVMTIPDELIAPTMQLLYYGVAGDPALVLGESGVAGVTAAIVACRDAHLASALELSAASRVLVFGTEGATDPSVYRQLVPDYDPRSDAP